ncbi:MAG: hypothetical protein M5U26_03440 [Planctomycetota bacterium]|nr:hypothetical protein [Planctomycetota bacterium]
MTDEQIYAFRYDYDAANNRQKMRREAAAAVETQSAYYAYDAANQMTRRLVFTPPSTFVSTYFKYDANGALAKEWDTPSGNTTHYEYGLERLVTKIVPPAGDPWHFHYDGQLNRYAIDRGGTLTYYLWDGPRLLEERNAACGCCGRPAARAGICVVRRARRSRRASRAG